MLPVKKRPRFGPLASDVLRNGGASPEPRLSDKHASNPPIVTIFGAGIAGLTAAHELVDRGFLVQVIEQKRDAYAKGRPQVGGMAATQYARVRANVEDLHRDLLANESRTSVVVQWLLRLFGFNRSWWLQTERPIEIHGCIYSRPNEAANGSTIGRKVVDLLTQGKRRYRDNWIWDLAVRSVYIKAITPERSGEQATHDLITLAWQIYDDLKNEKSAEVIAETILEVEQGQKGRINDRASDRPPANAGAEAEGAASAREAAAREAATLPKLPESLEGFEDLVSAALEREFLWFRLLPFTCDEGNHGVEKAEELLREWQTHLADHGLGWNLDRAPVRVKRASQPMQLDGIQVDHWLELDIIEERLPGEHGFRFFPSYYRHLDHTMKRIPLFDGERNTYRTAYDNLRPTTKQAIGLSEEDRVAHLGLEPLDDRAVRNLSEEDRKARHQSVETRRDRATSFEGLRDRTDRFLRALGCTPKDGALFSARLLRFMTTCPERRRTEYQDLSWAEFVGTKDTIQTAKKAARKALPYSQPMKDQIERAAQCVLALSAAEADARTYGDATVQLFMDTFADGSRTDRTLNGPTSDAWLEPWREHLERQGVRFFLGSLDGVKEVETSIERADGSQERRIELVPVLDSKRDVSQDGHKLLTHEGVEEGRKPDFYVLALDLATASDLLNGVVRAGADSEDKDTPTRDFNRLVAFHREAVNDRALRGLTGGALRGMTGVQFFFDSKTGVAEGHMYFPYSGWGLSSISQSEFWSDRGGFADGYLGVLSVDVARMDKSFEKAHRDGARPATDGGEWLDDRFGRWRVANEVWTQLEGRIGVADMLPEPRVFHVDQNIGLRREKERDPVEPENATPYLAAMPGQWENRPGLRADGKIEYALAYDRWVMCGTFMATHTRMTSMEAANESARHAVCTILKKLHEEDALEPRGLTLDGFRAFADFRDVTARAHTGATHKYNGASRRRRYDPPEIWNPEAEELEDLAMFRRLDKALLGLELGHWMDICDLDRRLCVMLDVAEVYDKDLKATARGNLSDNLMKLSVANLETVLRDALGDDKYVLEPAMQRIEKIIKALP